MEFLSRLWENMQNVNGIIGTIAIATTFTVCAIALIQAMFKPPNDREIPDILKVALAAMIGYYFGTSAPKQASPPPPTPAVQQNQ
jgi:hypothetical protein